MAVTTRLETSVMCTLLKFNSFFPRKGTLTKGKQFFNHHFFKGRTVTLVGGIHCLKQKIAHEKRWLGDNFPFGKLSKHKLICMDHGISSAPSKSSILFFCGIVDESISSIITSSEFFCTFDHPKHHKTQSLEEKSTCGGISHMSVQNIHKGNLLVQL